MPSRKKHLGGFSLLLKGVLAFSVVVVIFGMVSSGMPFLASVPSGPVLPTGATNFTLNNIYRRLTTNGSTPLAGHPFAPSQTPDEAQQTTLKQIYEAIPTVDPSKYLDDTVLLGHRGTVAVHTLSNTTTAVGSGYYATTDLTTVEPHLNRDNIRIGVDLFGIMGIFGYRYGGFDATKALTTADSPGTYDVTNLSPPVVMNGLHYGSNLVGTLSPHRGTTATKSMVYGQDDVYFHNPVYDSRGYEYHQKWANTTDDWRIDSGSLVSACMINPATDFDGVHNLVPAEHTYVYYDPMPPYMGPDYYTKVWCISTAPFGASSGRVLIGKQYGLNRNTGVGSMPDREGDNAAASVTYAGTSVLFNAPYGFYDGNDRAYASQAQIQAIDTDLSIANVRQGATIFGVTGTWVPGPGVLKTGRTATAGLTGQSCGNGSNGGCDDAHYQKGLARSFQNGVDTVTDTSTRLMWQKCSDGQGPSGASCDGTALSLSFEDARDYCESLVLGTYADWRLPNINEQLSLLNLGAASGPLTFTASFPSAVADALWTSTKSASGHWTVDMGNATTADGTGDHSFRCVRAL